VPYDFDYSGFVDAPYALPPESIKVRSVRVRRYRGFCMHNDEARVAAAAFVAARPELLAALGETPGLLAKTRGKAARYLEGFFSVAGDPASLESYALKDCRQ